MFVVIQMTSPLHRPMTVLTTIQSPTSSVLALKKALDKARCPLIVIGDKKGPFEYAVDDAELVTLEAQKKLSFKIVERLPAGHYARKNIGYLLAMSRGATSIYETDDDNAPLPTWKWRQLKVKARGIDSTGWINVYRCFTQENIWPRGYPLHLAAEQPPPPLVDGPVEVEAPIQQGLSNGAPDVDAVWRMALGKKITFEEKPSVYAGRGVWCPFNSQSTWWWPAAYPLMYLPSYCSFRMTDVWRSLVAQRCIWELGTGMIFHPAEVVQERNAHNIMQDFQDEIPGYLKNCDIVNMISGLPLKPGAEHVGTNLLHCYETMVANEIFPPTELQLVRAWLADVDGICSLRGVSKECLAAR